jgi:hypothetical protein
MSLAVVAIVFGQCGVYAFGGAALQPMRLGSANGHMRWASISSVSGFVVGGACLVISTTTRQNDFSRAAGLGITLPFDIDRVDIIYVLKLVLGILGNLALTRVLFVRSATAAM